MEDNKGFGTGEMDDRVCGCEDSGQKDLGEQLQGCLNFSTFILSLTTSMLVNLGELPDPVSKQKNVNLPLAKQTIGIIEMLKDKTIGNLSADEAHLVDSVLFDLRIKYVSLASSKQ